MPNAAKEMAVPAISETRPTTAALAARKVRRCGTAARLVRMSPVEYSEVMASTPRTPIASCPSSSPARLLPRTSLEEPHLAHEHEQPPTASSTNSIHAVGTNPIVS
jgi:hypothetical protein